MNATQRTRSKGALAPWGNLRARAPLLLGIAALIVSIGRAVALTPEETEFFEKKIRPVLVAECYECHNAEKTKGGLRLDYRDGWRKGGDSGDAIVPGNPAKSLLIDSIKHSDPDLKMPDKAPKLEDSVIADFEKWIAMGAPDPRDEPPAKQASKPTWSQLLDVRKTWWSLQPVQKPAVPAVKDPAWSGHPVDRFLLAKMEEKGLEPAADADARTFIRRLAFALTGLPPTPDEVESFAADSIRDPQSAIRNLATRLLASPRFGEHWARHWMDLMRYAETHGSEGDPEIREAWRYRDYLIRAFNSSVPEDQLIREHLAGDLLPQPRMNPAGFNESMLGTAQFRFVEHGFQPVDTLDDQVKAVDNQIDVVSKAFQATTVSCARCHDHKFDAVSQRDFTALYGIFASCRPAQVTIDAPEVQTKNRAPLERLHGEIQSALAEAWLASAQEIGTRLLHDRGEEIRLLETKLAALESGITPQRAVVPSARWDFANGKVDGVLEGGAEIRDGRLILSGKGGYFHATLPKTLLAKTLEAWVSPATLDQKGGGVISLETTREHGFDAIVFAEKDPRQWVPGSNHFKRSERLNAPQETAQPGEFIHVAVTYAADGTITFYRNGQPYGASYAKPPLLEFPADGARVLLGLRHKGAGNGFFAGEIDEARLYDRALTRDEVAASFRAGAGRGPSEAEILAALSPEKRAEREAVLARLTALRGASSSLDAALAGAAKDEANPFSLWAALREVAPAEFAEKWTRLAEHARQQIAAARDFNRQHFRPMWDLAGGDYAKWFRYGSGLAAEPAAPGGFSIVPEGDRILAGLLPAGIFTHRLSDRHNGLLTSPNFKIDSDGILVRAAGGGGAAVRVLVDHYPLPSNPIFPKALLEGEEPGWVRMDTAYRKGSMAYLEFGTREDLTRPLPDRKDTAARKRYRAGSSFFAVDRIVRTDGKEMPRAENLVLLPLLEGPAPQSAVQLATRYGAVVAAAVAAWRDGRLAEPQRALLDFLVRRGVLPTTLPELEKVRPLVAEYRRLEAEVPRLQRAPGLLETTGSDAPLYERGEHTKPGAPVPRGYLAVLGAQPVRTPFSGRLELAAEIASARNPLTTRVMVNRIWHWLFGRGLVPTVDDFGRLGEKPTHPELLEYLAAEFVERGWSTQEMIRHLVTTRAFAMSSTPSPHAAEIDPANETLSHFRVRRLSAEAVRDALLATSGQLDLTMYGRSAAPDEPRRSLYLEVERTNLNPFLQVFDAPKPFTTLGRRDLTNVPAQSLTMLNSPFVIEQAAGWAASLVKDGSRSLDERVSRMFATAFARPPADYELAAAKAYLEALAADRHEMPEAQLASVRVWQDFAQSLFNVKEFIYVR
jgi:cytochrome c553